MSDFERFSLFTDARERLGRSFAAGVSAALPQIARALEQAAEQSGSIAERSGLVEAAQALRTQSSARAQRALARLFDLSFRVLEANQAAPVAGQTPPRTPISDDGADHPRLADALAQGVRDRLGPAYETALRRVAALTGTVPDDRCAPLGATVLAAAALDALRPLTSGPTTRAAIRAPAIAGLVPRLAEAIAATDAWLAARDVVPARPTLAAKPPEPPEPQAAADSAAPPGSIVVPSATSGDAVASSNGPDLQVGPDGPEAAPLAGSGSAGGRPSESVPHAEPVCATASTLSAPGERSAEALIRATEVADRLGRQPVVPGRAEAGYRYAAGLPRPDAIEQDAVAFAHHAGVAPYTREARQRFFESLRGRMQAAQPAPAQLAALDLVAGLFDYVIDDTRMPEAALPLLWRLQHPALTLAALDAGFLGEDHRSVRRLVEHLAAISVAYADDVVQGSELYRRLETVVRAVEVVAHAFQSRSSVLGEQVGKEYRRASQSVSQILTRIAQERTALEATPGRRNRRDFSRRPSRDREQTVTHRVERELRDRLGRHEVPESVREFLLGVWLRHLRTAVLRDGSDSSAYRLALQVVDDLLWSLDASGPRPSRSQLASRIPPLIRLLTQGAGDSGAKPEEFRPFLDELFLIHLRRMQKVPRDPLPGATVPAPDRRLDDDDTLPTLDQTLPDETAALGSEALAGSTAEGLRRADEADEADEADDVPAAGPEADDEPDLSVTAPGQADGDRPDDRSRRAPPSAARRGWLRRSSDRPEPSRRGIQRLGPEDDDPLESWSDADPDEAYRPLPAPSGASSVAAAAPLGAAAEPQPPQQPFASPAFAPESGLIEPDRPDERRLLSVLGELDLADFPEAPQRLRRDPDVALERLERGDWLELLGRDGVAQQVKVAWINPRRTVVLLVRRPDRRAMSLRTAELRERFAQHRAALIR